MNIATRWTRTIAGLALGAIALSVAAWSYAQSIAPFQQREREARSAALDLRARIGNARVAIEDFRKFESDSQEIRRQISQLGQDLPEGAAATWMPEMLKTHFAAFGLDASIVRLNTVRDEPDLPGFNRAYWSVGVPLAEAAGNEARSLLAVAEFEKQHPFVRVLDFAIRPDPERPAARIALLNVAALIRK
jgi:hypothetical protein